MPGVQASQPQGQARRWHGGSQRSGGSASQSHRFGFCFNSGHFRTAGSNASDWLSVYLDQGILLMDGRKKVNGFWCVRPIRSDQFIRAQRRQSFKEECWGHTSIQMLTRVRVPSCVFWITTVWPDKQRKRESGVKELLLGVNVFMWTECVIGLYYVRMNELADNDDIYPCIWSHFAC